MFGSKKKIVRKFELGATLKDKITGFEGVATGVASYITGCDQFCLQPKVKDGDFKDSKWFDDNRLEAVNDTVLKLELEKEVGACCTAPTKQEKVMRKKEIINQVLEFLDSDNPSKDIREYLSGELSCLYKKPAEMSIDFNEQDFGEGVCFAPIVDDKEYRVYFETKGQALVYAGLAVSGLSANDCSYLGGYIGTMISGLKKGE